MTPLLEGAERCPHCGGLTVIEPSPSLRWRCAVCGGGRVPGLPNAELGARAVASLVEARRERAAQVGAAVFAIVFLLGAVMAGTVATVAFALHAVVAGAVVAGLAVAAAVACVTMRRLARRSAAASREALDEGWADAAARITARTESITAPQLARAMRIGEPEAEAILGRMSARGARVAVDDDAELRYRIDAQAVESREASQASEAGETNRNDGGSHAR